MIFMNVPLFSRYKSCAKKTATRDAHAMRLGQSYSGELIRAKGVRCLYLALGRHLGRIRKCPLSGVKRTWALLCETKADMQLALAEGLLSERKRT